MAAVRTMDGSRINLKSAEELLDEEVALWRTLDRSETIELGAQPTRLIEWLSGRSSSIELAR